MSPWQRIATGIAGGVVATFVLMLASGERSSRADSPDPRSFNERCATRLSIAFLGAAPSADLLASNDPKREVDAFMKRPEFQERFARFINTQFNDAPGASALEDAPYYIVKRVLTDGRPWSDVFMGKFRLAPIASNVAVFEDAEGLGYFRSEDWYRRYEGNEEKGVKLATAYRIMNNVVGLRVSASTGTPTTDQTATGREAAGCRHCHYDSWFALDKVASILPVKGASFDSYKGGAREMLGGKQIANDEELVRTLVESENFSVNACRLAFRFLYARDDNRCEGTILDRCVDTFKAEKSIQSALKSIAQEPTFCE